MKHQPYIHNGSDPYICPNCNGYLRSADTYCPFCGQKKMEKEDFSVRHIFRESFLDYFHIDSTLTKSIVPLLLKPGYLTVEYLNGKRASYVQPFKMFLIVTLIYFLLGNIEMPQLLQPTKKIIEKPVTTPKIAYEQIDTTKNQENLRIGDEDIQFEPVDTMKMKIRKYGINVYVKSKYPTAGTFLRYLIKKVIQLKLSEVPFSETFRHTTSKLIFLLIPFAALLFKLIYIKRKRFYYEHVIFSLHFHTVVFLLFIVFQLIAILYMAPMLLQLIIILIYLFFAMKKMYSQSIPRTIGNLFLFLVMYILIAMPFFLILLAGVSLATY